ncbi:hypothetical protein VAR608DRAFT_5212 [Variovorax sp. HW608]|uniref:hypothetical protein n=1 Tax=Variovorax sp. HW608 TaxID=1034889 RepID=UPI00081FF907|nr:hypothetical protein [Variovorax sp. HW608]SCK51740.1 hypothetical protein VAR608DRAFT_5212 [Variovorax sp. HW608]
MGRGLAFVCATALIGGCATQPSTTPGTGSGASYLPMVDMQGVDPDTLTADVAACRTVASNVRVLPVKGQGGNEVADAVALGVGIVVPFGFVGMAVFSGIASGLNDETRPRVADAPLQQRTLVNCMARKGYRNLDPHVTVAYVPQPPAAAGAKAFRTGRDTYVAESYAKANICHGPARALLESKGPGFERHSVVCADGQRTAVRCEFGNCAPEPTDLALGE